MLRDIELPPKKQRCRESSTKGSTGGAIGSGRGRRKAASEPRNILSTWCHLRRNSARESSGRSACFCVCPLLYPIYELSS